MMKNVIKKIKNITLAEWTLVLFVASRFITWICTSLVGRKGIYLVIFLFVLLYAAIVVKKLIKKDYTMLLVFFSIALLVGLLAIISATGNRFRAEWIFHPSRGLVVGTFDPRKGIFALFLFLMIKDEKRILRSLQIGCGILFVHLTIQVILFLFSGNWENYYSLMDARSAALPYNLHLGYQYMLCFLVFEEKALRERNILAKALSLFSIFAAFYFGARGILLVAVSFYLLQLIFNASKQDIIRKKRIAVYVLICVVFIAGMIPVMDTASRYLKEQSVSSAATSPPARTESTKPTAETNKVSGSRTVNAILSNNMSNLTGREALWRYSLQAFKDSPLFGHGLFGDRLYVGNTFSFGYSHNILLELMASFGLFGILFFAVMLFLLIRFLILKEYAQYRALLIVLFAACFKLLISDSFWFSDMFWGLMGIFLIISEHSAQAKKGGFALRGKDGSLAKPLLIVSLSLFLAVLLSIPLSLITSAKKQINKEVVFDRPTVLISFEGSNESDYSAFHYFKEKGIAATSFISGNKIGCDKMLTGNMIAEMNANGWDFQDGSFNQNNLHKINRSAALAELEKTNAFFQQLGLEIPNAFASYYSTRNYSFWEDYVHQRNLILLSTGDLNLPLYNKLSPSDFFLFRSYKVVITEKDYQKQLDRIRQKIDEARNQNGLLALSFRIPTDEQSTRKLTSMEEIVQYLIEGGFEFITANELAEKGRMKDGEMTIANYLRYSEWRAFLP